MKRLLYLKASLDNENQNNMSNIPLEEDKAFGPSVSSRQSQRYRSTKNKDYVTNDNERRSTAADFNSETAGVLTGMATSEHLMQSCPSGPPKTAVGMTRPRTRGAGGAKS
jgi:hypothetical protein